MALVFAPFLSIAARKTLGKVLTASSWKGRAYMKMRFIPKNPKSAKQTARRLTMIDGVSKWRFRTDLIDAAARILWESYGKKHQYSGFNRYLSKYMKANYTKGDVAVADPQVIPDPS